MWFKCWLIWFEDHQHSLRVHRKEEICLHPSYSHLGNVFGKLNFLFLVFSHVTRSSESFLLKYTIFGFDNCERIEKNLFYLTDISGCEFKHRVRVESFSHLKRENKKIFKSDNADNTWNICWSLNLTILTPLTKPPGKIARFHPCLCKDKDHNQEDNEKTKERCLNIFETCWKAVSWSCELFAPCQESSHPPPPGC